MSAPPEASPLAVPLQQAGWLLAHQAALAAGGETPMPLLSLVADPLGDPKLVAPRTDSDAYTRQVLAGRVLLDQQASQLDHWAFAYDDDLGSSRVLLLEVGGPGFGPTVTFVQRYTRDGKGFRLVGDLAVVGRELLAPDFRQQLDSCGWLSLLTEGATAHDEVGQEWPRWYASRAADAARLELPEMSFAVPEGFAWRPTQDGQGWVLSRLLPWEYLEYEPTLLAVLVRQAGQRLEQVVEAKRAAVAAQGSEIVGTGIGESPANPAWRVGQVSWKGEHEGKSFQSRWTWVAFQEPGRFVLLAATSFQAAVWASLLESVREVLASLTLLPPKGGHAPEPRLKRLWKGRRG